NNEQEKLSGRDIERSKQYLDKYGSGRDEYFKHRVIGDGWISLYRSLQNGMRSEFVAPLWKSNSLFIGYNAFESPKFGLFSGWHNYSLYYPGRLQPWPLAWDGASVSYYLRFTDASSDFRVFSPQVEAMNWVFMLDEARRQSKNYWFELSTSDGQEPKRVALSADSIRYTPDRYRGMIQFGAWLLRPRVLREFRMWDDTVKRSGAYFSAITDTVDIVYRNEDLKRFWRYGELVANDNEKHPFQENIPSEYAAISRWYLLEASTNPKSLALDTEIPVYSIALALGNKPNREWLVYAYSPLRNRKNVTITIPHFSKVTIGASVKGSFYLVSEAGLKVKPIDLLY
ncbi:MAG TPA: hypothetical protein VFM46_03435, partial [Pseudomonadales bacterium]|nr:hypothetical protein [Pseudomonadales bacterium]